MYVNETCKILKYIKVLKNSPTSPKTTILNIHQPEKNMPINIWVCLKMSCTPLYPMVLLIIIPMNNGYFIGNINPTFSDISISKHAYPIPLLSHPTGHFPHGRSAPAHWPSRRAAVGWDVGPGFFHGSR